MARKGIGSKKQKLVSSQNRKVTNALKKLYRETGIELNRPYQVYTSGQLTRYSASTGDVYLSETKRFLREIERTRKTAIKTYEQQVNRVNKEYQRALKVKIEDTKKINRQRAREKFAPLELPTLNNRQGSMFRKIGHLNQYETPEEKKVIRELVEMQYKQILKDKDFHKNITAQGYEKSRETILGILRDRLHGKERNEIMTKIQNMTPYEWRNYFENNKENLDLVFYDSNPEKSGYTEVERQEYIDELQESLKEVA